MRTYLWWLLFVACCLNLSRVRAKPLVSFGIGLQTSRPYPAPYTDPYYNNYYGYGYGGTYSSRYPTNYPYAPSYYPAPAPYAPGNHYTTGLDIGIGALSLAPFLL